MTTHVFETMGTVVSLRTENAPHAADVRAVEGVFHRYDRTYSLYDDSSPLSQVARGDLRLPDTSPDVRETYAQALEWRDKTFGLFTPHRPDGVVDLSGIVKALAIRDAGAVLDASGEAWLLSVGGDCLGRTSDRMPAWRIGIVDPADSAGLVGVATLGAGRRAMASSGTAERGDHIWSSNGTLPFMQATVVADDIVTADVLATAVIAGLRSEFDQLTSMWNIDAMTIDRSGSMLATPGARAWIDDAGSVGAASE